MIAVLRHSEGYDPAIFLKGPPSNLECTICLHILRNPVQCPRGHVFCEECILNALRHTKKCPTCRCDLNSSQLGPCLVLQKILNSLEIRCPNKINGSSSGITCDWTGTIESSKNHCADNCLLQIIRCGYSGCSFSGVRSNMMTHTSTCDYVVVKCRYDECSYRALRYDIRRHENHCEHVYIPCPNNCTITNLSQTKLTQHLLICENQLVSCPLVPLCHTCTNGKIMKKDLEHHICSIQTITICINEIRRLNQVVEELKKTKESIKPAKIISVQGCNKKRLNGDYELEINNDINNTNNDTNNHHNLYYKKSCFLYQNKYGKTFEEVHIAYSSTYNRWQLISIQKKVFAFLECKQYVHVLPETAEGIWQENMYGEFKPNAEIKLTRNNNETTTITTTNTHMSTSSSSNITSNNYRKRSRSNSDDDENNNENNNNRSYHSYNHDDNDDNNNSGYGSW